MACDQSQTKCFLNQQREQYKKRNPLWIRLRVLCCTNTSSNPMETFQRNTAQDRPTIVDSAQSKKLNQSFFKAYNELFLKGLQDAIIQNTTTLELEKARCLDILRHTEQALCISTDPPSLISKWYTDFLQQLNLESHVISPELKHKLEASTLHSPPSINTSANPAKLGTKRRREAQHPPTTPKPHPAKQPKIDHFLRKGQKQTQNIT